MLVPLAMPWMVFLSKSLNHFDIKSESIITNLGHFVQLLKYVNLQSLDNLTGFDVSSL
jgi:hypothetical protein